MKKLLILLTALILCLSLVFVSCDTQSTDNDGKNDNKVEDKNDNNDTKNTEKDSGKPGDTNSVTSANGTNNVEGTEGSEKSEATDNSKDTSAPTLPSLPGGITLPTLPNMEDVPEEVSNKVVLAALLNSIKPLDIYDSINDSDLDKIFKAYEDMQSGNIATDDYVALLSEFAAGIELTLSDGTTATKLSAALKDRICYIAANKALEVPESYVYLGEDSAYIFQEVDGAWALVTAEPYIPEVPDYDPPMETSQSTAPAYSDDSTANETKIPEDVNKEPSKDTDAELINALIPTEDILTDPTASAKAEIEALLKKLVIPEITVDDFVEKDGYLCISNKYLVSLIMSNADLIFAMEGEPLTKDELAEIKTEVEEGLEMTSVIFGVKMEKGLPTAVKIAMSDAESMTFELNAELNSTTAMLKKITVKTTETIYEKTFTNEFSVEFASDEAGNVAGMKLTIDGYSFDYDYNTDYDLPEDVYIYDEIYSTIKAEVTVNFAPKAGDKVIEFSLAVKDEMKYHTVEIYDEIGDYTSETTETKLDSLKADIDLYVTYESENKLTFNTSVAAPETEATVTGNLYFNNIVNFPETIPAAVQELIKEIKAA